MRSSAADRGRAKEFEINIGDRVRVIGVPENLPTADTQDGLPLQKLFELCVGRIFPVEDIAEGFAELHVGEIVDQPAYCIPSSWSLSCLR
jgi:hypothetical protein